MIVTDTETMRRLLDDANGDADSLRGVCAARDQLRSLGPTLARELIEAREALTKIATGDCIYGAQAHEYKNIARAALGMEKI